MKKILLTLLLAINGLGLCAQTMPNVKVEDMSGKQTDLVSVVKGKPFILSFWGITCKPCLLELDAINECLDDWKDEVDFEMVAVSIDDSRFLSRARSMAKGRDWQFTCLFDKNQDLKRAMNVTFTPHTFIFDSKGNVVYSHTGYVPGSEEELLEKLKELK